MNYITLHGLVLPLTEDVAFHAFLDMVGRMDHDVYALAEFGSAALSVNDV